LQIRPHSSKVKLRSGDRGFSLPEVLVALFITGLFVAVLSPIMRDTFYYVSRLTERLPMARSLELNLKIDRSNLAIPTKSVSFITNGLKVVRSIGSIKSLSITTLGVSRSWEPVMVSTLVESPSGIQLSKDIILLRKITK